MIVFDDDSFGGKHSVLKSRLLMEALAKPVVETSNPSLIEQRSGGPLKCTLSRSVKFDGTLADHFCQEPLSKYTTQSSRVNVFVVSLPYIPIAYET